MKYAIIDGQLIRLIRTYKNLTIPNQFIITCSSMDSLGQLVI